jgi:hypothetical protein
LKKFRIEGSVLRADLHFFENDDRVPKLLEMFDKIPDTFGLSVSCHGLDQVIGEDMFARCDSLFSVDIVGEPAGNPTGAFSSGPRFGPQLERLRLMFRNLSSAVDAAHFSRMAEETKSGDASKSPSTPAEYISKGELQTLLSAFEGRIAALEAKKKGDSADETCMSQLVGEIKNLGTKLEALNLVRGATSSAPGAAPGAEKEVKTKKDFTALVKEQIAAGVPKLDAIAKVVGTNPVEHKEFVAAGKRLDL